MTYLPAAAVVRGRGMFCAAWRSAYQESRAAGPSICVVPVSPSASPASRLSLDAAQSRTGHPLELIRTRTGNGGASLPRNRAAAPVADVIDPYRTVASHLCGVRQ